MELFTTADKPLLRQINPFAVVINDSADNLRATAAALQNGEDDITVFFADENAEADPHIADLVHLRATDAAVDLDQPEDRWHWRQVIDRESRTAPEAGEVGNSGVHRGDRRGNGGPASQGLAAATS